METIHFKGLTSYPDALLMMEERVSGIIAGAKEEALFLLEHEELYTAGTSAKEGDLLHKFPFPAYQTGRGGEYTYHGPGQRVVYLMLNLAKRDIMDLHRYVHMLEEWLIIALRKIGVNAFVRKGRIGIWVEHGSSEAKIAAIGIRVRKWVSFHGIALNINPNLEHFGGIIPCGIKNYGVISLEKLGINISMQEIDEILLESFGEIFGNSL